MAYGDDSMRTTVRLERSADFKAGARCFPKTKHIPDVLDPADEQLARAQEVHKVLKLDVRDRRGDARGGKYLLQWAIRKVEAAATNVNVIGKGRVYEALFPQHLGPVVERSGRQLLANAKSLLLRVDTSEVPGVEEVREQTRPRLAASIEDYERRLDALDEIEEEKGKAWAVEKAKRTLHKETWITAEAEVLKAYPTETRIRRAIIPPAPKKNRKRHGAGNAGPVESVSGRLLAQGTVSGNVSGSGSGNGSESGSGATGGVD